MTDKMGSPITFHPARQPVYDLHRLQTDVYDTQEQFQKILGVVHRLGFLDVCVVDDAAVGDSLDKLAFHDPFESGLAVAGLVGLGVAGFFANFIFYTR